MKNWSLSFVLLFLFISCEKDEPVASELTENLTYQDIVNGLTYDGDKKSWVIGDAKLTNSSVDNLNVTSAFNLKDDEFDFYIEGETLKLLHKQRNSFKWDALNVDEFEYDNYVSSKTYDLQITPNAEYNVMSNSGIFKFVFNGNANLQGIWSPDAESRISGIMSGESLSFTLNTKVETSMPSSLNFEEVTTFTVENYFFSSLGSADFLASQSENSLYLIYPNDELSDPDPTSGTTDRPEVVLKYSLADNSLQRKVSFGLRDFFTRRATFYDNKLHIVGTKNINSYNLTLSEDPASFAYTDPNSSDVYFRYDTVSLDDEIYILGGNPQLPEEGSPQFDKILKLNIRNNELEVLGTLPSLKAHAAAEMVDDKIYLFGGMQAFGAYNTPQALSYIIDTSSGEISSFNLPRPLHIVYSTVVNDKIYLAAELLIIDEVQDRVVDKDIYFAAYDTATGEVTELEHNLDDSDTVSTVMGLCYLNGKLYVVYGNGETDYRGSYRIMSTSIGD